ncbi:MAG TPA: isoaspartyl peptidase/L-asparaginase [Planctomycetota bacterium]|nr:isoaspartyl peptidase/L-asparaginase [Planctomycetota bacterium]
MSQESAGNLSIIVHGGAGDIPEPDRPLHLAGLERALERGWEILVRGGSALDAVEAAVRVLEDDPVFDAGVGSVLRLDGSISMDASVMEGTARRAGAVAGLSRVRHPVSLARYVLEKTPQVFFIAPGAEDLARSAGLELCDPSIFVTPREVERLARILEGGSARAALPFSGQGTVGAVARESDGRMAAATSTGGAPGSPSGRVGDTPIIGAGTFCDDREGGVSATGLGENMIRTTLAREVTRAMKSGLSAPEAAEWGTRHLLEETGGTCGLICIDRAGRPGAHFTTPWMGSLAREGPQKLVNREQATGNGK